MGRCCSRLAKIRSDDNTNPFATAARDVDDRWEYSRIRTVQAVTPPRLGIYHLSRHYFYQLDLVLLFVLACINAGIPITSITVSSAGVKLGLTLASLFVGVAMVAWHRPYSARPIGLAVVRTVANLLAAFAAVLNYLTVLAASPGASTPVYLSALCFLLVILMVLLFVLLAVQFVVWIRGPAVALAAARLAAARMASNSEADAGSLGSPDHRRSSPKHNKGAVLWKKMTGGGGKGLLTSKLAPGTPVPGSTASMGR